MRVPSQWMISSRVTVAWNIVGYLVYAALAFVGGFAVWFSLFFAMATDGCHDSACDASYHVFPAMVTMWIGVGAVLLLTATQVCFPNASFEQAVDNSDRMASGIGTGLRLVRST